MLQPIDRARRYLAQCPPAVSGQAGHDQTYKAAVALVHGFALSEMDALCLLREWNAACQPPWSERELLHKVESAATTHHDKPRGHLLGGMRVRYQGDRQTAPIPPKNVEPIGRNSDLQPSKKYDVGKLIDVPDPMPDGCRQLLMAAFQAGEGVGIAQEVLNDEKRGIPKDGGATLSREEWLKKLDQHGDPNRIFSSTARTGAFVRINPMRIGGTRDADVLAFRHALLEFDQHSMTEQWNLITQSRVPCTAALHSGGKSMHAWVRVDAANRKEYDERVKILFWHFREYGVDAKNKNPSRFSRLPGMVRGAKRQELLALNIGAASWAEWLAENSDDGLPKELDQDRMMTFMPEDDENSLIGRRWLCRGSSLIIQGQSGIGKSSLLMQMAITWAFGRDLFGIRPKQPLRSMIIQAENDEGDMAEMYQGVCLGLGVDINDASTRAHLKAHLSFYREPVRTGDEFIDMVWRLHERSKGVDIIFADPLLTYMADDISKQAVVSRFLRTQLNRFIDATKVVWIWMHHVGKPSQDPKSQRHWNEKDMSYAGFGSSELANWARETANLARVRGPENVYALTLTKRGTRAGLTDADGQEAITIYLQHSSRGICWERSSWKPKPREEKDGGSEPRKGKGAPSKIEKVKAHLMDFAASLEPGFYSQTGMAEHLVDYIEDNEVVKKLGITTAKGLVKTMEKDGQITLIDDHYLIPSKHG